MGIDFDRLVLNVGVTVFGDRVVVYPLASRPGRAPYNARGVYNSQFLNVEMQDGTVFSDQQTTLGIREAEFQHLPVRGDQIKIVKTGKTYWVRDSNRDGQGGTMLQLAEREPQ